MAIAIQKSFRAWIDKTPPSGDTLHVKGRVQVPTTGHKVALVATVPQGINPEILILAVRDTPPSRPAGDVITTLDVKFDKRPSGGVKSVTINRAGPSFTIEVTTTQ